MDPTAVTTAAAAAAAAEDEGDDDIDVAAAAANPMSPPKVHGDAPGANPPPLRMSRTPATPTMPSLYCIEAAGVEAIVPSGIPCTARKAILVLASSSISPVPASLEALSLLGTVRMPPPCRDARGGVPGTRSLKSAGVGLFASWSQSYGSHFNRLKTRQVYAEKYMFVALDLTIGKRKPGSKG